MPSPYGGGVGGEDDGFLGLDSGSFWSRFGLQDPMGGQQEQMGPVDTLGPEYDTPRSEIDPIRPAGQDPARDASAPLDALYSMIGMQPLNADAMGRYNLTDEQRKSSSRGALSDTLGAAAKVMFGTGSVDQLIDAGTGYGDRRDASLDRFSGINKGDYETKVDMAIKGSNLLRQQTIIEAEQEKLQSIMDQKEFGAQWAESMQPVWEKYANKVAEIDPDKAKEYAATLTMVKAKALSGDMAGATLMFDTANKAMVPGKWEEEIKEDIVRAQFAKSAEFAGFDEVDAALQNAMPGWKMGMKDGKMVPLSPADQQREKNQIDVLAAQASNYREQNSNVSLQNQIVRAQIGENKRIAELAQKGSGALIEALSLAGIKGKKTSDTVALANAEQAFGEYIPYLQAAGALGQDPANFKNEIKALAASPQRLAQAIAQGARMTSSVYQQYGDGMPQGGQQAPLPAQAAGAGQPQGAGMNLGAQIGKLNQGIQMLGTQGGPDLNELLSAIDLVKDPQAKVALRKAISDKVQGLQQQRVHAQ